MLLVEAVRKLLPASRLCSMQNTNVQSLEHQVQMLWDCGTLISSEAVHAGVVAL
jgi:hypothetical protein